MTPRPQLLSFHDVNPISEYCFDYQCRNENWNFRVRLTLGTMELSSSNWTKIKSIHSCKHFFRHCFRVLPYIVAYNFSSNIELFFTEFKVDYPNKHPCSLPNRNGLSAYDITRDISRIHEEWIRVAPLWLSLNIEYRIYVSGFLKSAWV